MAESAFTSLILAAVRKSWQAHYGNRIKNDPRSVVNTTGKIVLKFR